MARKATVTKEMILESAFSLMTDEGYEQVTARKLAAKAGCSTQPIFRLYDNMEQVIADVYEMAISSFDSFYASFPKNDDTPFVNLGMAYISFAASKKNIFRLLFMSSYRGERSMYDLLNKNTGAVGTEIAKAKEKGVGNPGNLFMQMWIFIHGAACMSLTGDFDLSDQETLQLLKEAYRSFC